MAVPAGWNEEPAAVTSLADLCERVTNFVEGCADEDDGYPLTTTRQAAIEALRGVLDDLQWSP